MMFLFVLIGFVFSVDPCLDFGTYRSREESLECARSVHFDKELFDKIIDWFVKGVDGDAPHLNYQIYKDISKYSGYPFYISVDLFKELEDLKSKPFTNWFDAIDSVWMIWKSLKDVTCYWIANIFSQISFFHPISVLPFVDNSTSTMTLKINHNPTTRGFFDEYNKIFKTTIDFEKYNGWIIKEINGKDAVEYFKDYSQNKAVFNRDIGANFNELVKQTAPAAFYRYYFLQKMYMPIPESPVTYIVENPENGSQETLDKIDYISCFWNESGCSPIDDTDYLTRLVFPKPSEEDSSVQSSSSVSVPHIEIKKKEKDDIESRYLSSSSYEIICKGTKSNFYLITKHDEPKIAFLQVLGESNFDDDGNVYAKDVIKCVKEIKTRGFEKLVLDLRYNGGGFSRISFLIAAAISRITFPDPGEIQTPSLATVEAYSELKNPKFGYFEPIITVMKAKFYDGHPEHKMVMPDSSIKTYGPLFRLDSSDVFSYPDLKVQTGFKGFEPEDIMVISHGSAISARGELFKFLQLTHSAKIGVIGGFPDIPIDGSCVDAGLTITNVNTLKTETTSYLNKFQVTLGSVFPPSPLYSVYDKNKLDFSKFYELQEIVEPDFRYYEYLDLGVGMFSDEIVGMIKSDFENCVSWNIRVDPNCDTTRIEHGVFGNPCVNGEYKEDICVLKRCDDGYFMNEDKTGCLKIEDAPLYKNFEASFEKKKENPTTKKKSNAGYIVGIAVEAGVMVVLLCVVIGLTVSCICLFCFCFVVCSLSMVFSGSLGAFLTKRGNGELNEEKYDQL